MDNMEVNQFVSCVESCLKVVCDVRGAVCLEKLTHSVVLLYLLLHKCLADGFIPCASQQKMVFIFSHSQVTCLAYSVFSLALFVAMSPFLDFKAVVWCNKLSYSLSIPEFVYFKILVYLKVLFYLKCRSCCIFSSTQLVWAKTFELNFFFENYVFVVQITIYWLKHEN